MPRLHSMTLLLLAALPASAQTPVKPKPAAGAPGAAPAAQAKPAPSFKEAKLTAIDAWLTANKTSTERGEALTEAAHLAFDACNWVKAKGYAETYLKEQPKGSDAIE